LILINPRTWTAGAGGAYDDRVHELGDDVEAFAPDEAAAPGPAVPRMIAGEEGGEAACYAHLVCAECGAVTAEGHRDRCSLSLPQATPTMAA
jgi:hypothetical protein